MKLFWSILAFAVAVAAQTAWPISSTNYTDAVQWDHYSLIVKGERLVVWSGEFVRAIYATRLNSERFLTSMANTDTNSTIGEFQFLIYGAMSSRK
jgi:hypothetical protein